VLRIKELRLRDFRSYSSLVLNDLGRSVVIVGDNATGKTNIIEGLQLLTSLQSFRHPRADEVVRNGAEKASARISFEAEGRTLEISMDVAEGKRSYCFNGKPAQRSSLAGTLPSVLFTPDDLAMIKGASGERREMVDSLGSRIAPSFITIRQDYTRILRQKGQILKEENPDADVLASWNVNLARVGAALYVHRRRLLQRLAEGAERVYREFSATEEIMVEYEPSWEARGIPGSGADISKGEAEEMLTEALAAAYRTECSQKRCLIGPHRDEIRLLLNNKDSRRFASQGQQRSLALALRIAEIVVLREVLGREPVLLLDDVMSELDEKRRAVLVRTTANTGQTFITTTDLKCFPPEAAEGAQIIRLPVDGVQNNAAGG
jgi:DNA replication and repair protein RecF